MTEPAGFSGGSARPVPDMVGIPPGPRSRALLQRQRRVLYPGLGEHVAPFVMARKAGYTIEDVDGNLYLDMVSGSASVPLGAGHPDLLDAAVAALRLYGNEDTHFITSELVAPLAEKLIAMSPAGLTRVDIALNGTEAVEIALKCMRRATGRPLVVGFFGGYHGESTTTATLGAEAAEIGRGLRHLSPGFVHVPYPNPYRTPFGEPRVGGSGDATIDYLRDFVLFHAVDPADVAGVVIEPVIGSGGVLAPSETFWRALADLCREFDWLLCADEVKTGMGRTGRMFAVDHWGVQPDLLCLGKALGGGVMPIGAVLGSERALGSFEDVPTGSTWSWLPAGCAAALATISALERPGVLEHVRALEVTARNAFGRLGERHQAIGDVRVKGALIAVEFVADRASKSRTPAFQDAVARACLERGLLTDPSTTSLNVQPSLVTPLSVLEHAAALLSDAIAAVLANPPTGDPWPGRPPKAGGSLPVS